MVDCFIVSTIFSEEELFKGSRKTSMEKEPGDEQRTAQHLLITVST